MGKPRVIIFDVMETLVTEPFFTAVPAFFGMTCEGLQSAKHPTAWIEFEEGRITEAEYFDRFFLDRRAVDGEGLRQCLEQAYRWVDGMEGLLTELKAADCEMHALSNYPVWYALIDESLRLSRFLHWTFVSCLTGVRKPDPQAYLGAAAALQLEPKACLFIDDRVENVEAATAVGMDAILKVDSTQVRNELAQREVLARRS